MLTYLFAIFAINIFAPYTQSKDDTLQYRDRWSNLGQAFITLFQLLTLDHWFGIQEDMQRAVRPWIVIIFFICWVWIGSFVFRNAFVGVMGNDIPFHPFALFGSQYIVWSNNSQEI
jgi:hypothetical protein